MMPKEPMRELYPVGTRISTLEGLRGVIVRHEFHESGRISPIPYLVEWDHPTLASQQRGLLSCYVPHEEVWALTPLPAPLLTVRC